MADPELKPCPFCGGPASFEDTAHSMSEGTWSVGCNNDDCIGYMSVMNYDRKKTAAERWNRRTQPPSDV